VVPVIWVIVAPCSSPLPSISQLASLLLIRCSGWGAVEARRDPSTTAAHQNTRGGWGRCNLGCNFAVIALLFLNT
jgi:hypothetical protein